MIAALALYAFGVGAGALSIGAALWTWRGFRYPLQWADLRLLLFVSLLPQTQLCRLAPLYGPVVEDLPRIEFVTRPNVGTCEVSP